MSETTKFLLREDADPDALGQPAARPAGRAAPAAQPGHGPARRARRPHADLPDGADPAGGLGRAGGRDPRGRCARPTGCGGRRRCTARAGSSARSTPPRASTTSTRASRPPARTSRTPRCRRRTRTRRPASRSSRPRPAPGQWGSALALRVLAVRARVRGLHGRLELRPEALPALDDGDLGRDRAPLAVATSRVRPLAGRAPDRLARHRDLRGGRGRRAGRRTELRARLGAQPRAACTRP